MVPLEGHCVGQKIILIFFSILKASSFFATSVSSALFLPIFFHSVGNWSYGWIDLYRCGHCRSDGSVCSCVNKFSACLHTFAYMNALTHLFTSSFLHFFYWFISIWVVSHVYTLALRLHTFVHNQTVNLLLLHLNLLPLKLNHQHAYWIHPHSPLPSLRLLISLCSGLSQTILTPLCVCISHLKLSLCFCRCSWLSSAFPKLC